MIISGVEVSTKLKTELIQKVELLKKKGIDPCLATILVGDDQPSAIYIRNKHKACSELGIKTKDNTMPSSIEEEKLIELINSLNNDPSVHGILLQLPLPSHIDQFEVINKIKPTKDVDGLTYQNAGLLLNKKSSLIPCTPLGVMELFNYYKIELKGKDIVIINRSILVGKPLFLLLLEKDATVTICHSKTRDLEEKLRRADIIITAVGNRKLFTLKREHVKENVVIIDIGISRENGKIIGDTDFERVAPKASWITPVPGGVGPMTITMLLNNTIKAASNF
ncbi:MAG TPA: tetrahydrofolate dehydrogenase/cyclohydrolase catalytic domain-containing protein [Nitrososphaeraceae archaeon]|jgi:methylenetetrahydrofolate dehydrogenase (NADP+)/methenyltetrahydrofolate cyclohydrolase|nr:tetrahydrofolate dehydrogenase/cyclohydrolase catalytic domain-containing protein [Nitrososphaeraceae archaeon]